MIFEKSVKIIAASAKRLGVEVSHLLQAAEWSSNYLENFEAAARDELKSRRGVREVTNENIDVIVFGSFARGEASEGESDFDHVFVVYGEIQDPADIIDVRTATREAQRRMTASEAGKYTGFGSVVSSLDLVNLIGLEDDTNRNHTNRILLLAESRSLLNSEARKKLMRTVLTRYLYDYLHGGKNRGPHDSPKRGVPRFLLNDVNRFWNTMAVDYQGKRWVEFEDKPELKWGMRYLKLRSTRKLMYFGTAFSLLLLAIRHEAPSVDFLAEQFDMTPMARLAQLEQYLEDQASREHLKAILGHADYFCDRFAQADVRDDASKVLDPADNLAPPSFREIRTRTCELHEALTGLLSSDAPLNKVMLEGGKPLTLRYLRDRYLLF
ncbi:MAG: hypothetical protein FD180_712 [Planctomycetota bacterium]|nr:MAG: hypothetical protein FD180_712 [Planctomycetota bacterium]